VTLDAFQDYLEGPAQTWERLALTRARVIYSTGDFGYEVTEAIRAAIGRMTDPEAMRRDVLAMRRRLEDTASPRDLRRCPGGIADVEFLVQYLWLRQARGEPLIVRPNVWDAIEWLTRAGYLPREAEADLVAAYDFYRTVEGRLRIIHNRSCSEWPDDDEGLARLVRRLGHPEGNGEALAGFRRDVAHHTEAVRRWFDALVGPVKKAASRSS
jgi:glutamate-ammonia-ligase adenylyltransferase